MYFYVTTTSAELVKWLKEKKEMRWVIIEVIYNVMYFYVTHKLSLKLSMI